MGLAGNNFFNSYSNRPAKRRSRYISTTGGVTCDFSTHSFTCSDGSNGYTIHDDPNGTCTTILNRSDGYTKTIVSVPDGSGTYTVTTSDSNGITSTIYGSYYHGIINV